MLSLKDHEENLKTVLGSGANITLTNPLPVTAASGLVIAKISGEVVRTYGYYQTSGDWRALAVDASGELNVAVTVADIVRARISGDVVKVSGEMVIAKVSGETLYPVTLSGDYVVVSGQVTLPSTQAVKVSGEWVEAHVLSGEVVSKVSGEVVKVSGETVIAKVSGEKVYGITLSGDYVVVSGQVTLPSTQVVKVSGEWTETHVMSGQVVAKTSGEVVKISGETIDTRTPTKVFSGGQTLCGSISGGVVLISGAVVSALVKAKTSNALEVYIGGAAGTEMPYSGYGYPLWPGDAVTLDIDNPNVIKAFGCTSGDIVYVAGIK